MKRIKKNQVIITALAIMIAVAGYINYTGNLSDIISVKNTKEASADANSDEIVNNDAEPDDQSLEEPGTVILTSGGVSSSVISEAKLNREQVRAKSKETLLNIINNNEISEENKTAAVNELAQITEYSEKEIASELLLEAKGFGDVVVSIANGSVDVVVNTTSITDSQRAQIEDIVKRKTGLPASKITINVCNNLNN
ncbi:MAG: SpoIIIAH-like family protein [Lachnospira sp.]|nr:SpoIIIAH-like family protein [Lachnospira sp.]